MWSRIGDRLGRRYTSQAGRLLFRLRGLRTLQRSTALRREGCPPAESGFVRDRPSGAFSSNPLTRHGAALLSSARPLNALTIARGGEKSGPRFGRRP